MILLTTDHYWLRQVVMLRISIEGTSLSAESCGRVGTHIDRTVETRLQKLDVEAKLILIGPANRMI
jgi:hypothetical protein